MTSPRRPARFLRRVPSRFTYANVVATVALFVALGGSSYAALTITGKSVKDSSLTGKDVKNESLTGSDVKRLTAKDFASPLPAGPAGPQGQTGPEGAPNPSAATLQGRTLSNWKLAEVVDASGPLPKEGSYTSAGGKLLISVAGSGYRLNPPDFAGNIGMRVMLDGVPVGQAGIFASEVNSHKAFVGDYAVASPPAGVHTIRLEARYDPLCHDAEPNTDYCTTTDTNDQFRVSVIEIPG
jgi:hypothetical protein